MRPVIRGSSFAVSSRTPQATDVAYAVLRAGGNAFDAAVAGQAALGVTDPAMNGVGSDACILIHDARAGKVISLNAEGTAPKLATIEWYRKNAGGKIPANDTLLAASLPGIVDAWYLMLDRWGTMTLGDLLQPAIELADKGFPISDSLAGTIKDTAKIRKYPTTARINLPDGHARKGGDYPEKPGSGADSAHAGGSRTAGLRPGTPSCAQGCSGSLLQRRHRALDGEVLGGERRALPLR